MKAKKILPGSTIGILGGGQLGRMIAIEARKMGYKVICMDPQPASPCGQLADQQVVAPFDDLESARHLAQESDVLIYEFENINADLVEELEREYYLPQGSNILRIAQNRVREKKELQKAGFPVADFRIVNKPEDLEKGINEIGYPCLLKTAEGGYDGKGQLVLESEADYSLAQDAVSNGSRQWVLEQKIFFSHEISVIVARGVTGEIQAYPASENIHRDNILYMNIVPARVPDEDQKAAVEMAEAIAAKFDVTGLLAVEFFVTSGGVLVNELAPRPHNSGHYTFDACYVSQFEQLIRGVCGLPLGTGELLFPVVMLNILGKDMEKLLNKIETLPQDVKLHLYGKHGEPEKGRKMGHLIIRGTELNQPADCEEAISNQKVLALNKAVEVAGELLN